MQRIDLLIGIALAVAVAGSAFGIATYDDDRLARFRGTWTILESDVSAPPATLTGAGTAEIVLDVPLRNITSALLTVAIEGRAARAAPVEVFVEVTVPGLNGTFTQESELPVGPTGSIDVPLPIDVRSPPPELDGAVQGATTDEARAMVDDVYGSGLGLGNWTVRVTLAPGAPGPLGAEDFTLEATAMLTRYEVELAPETPEVTPR